MRTPRGGMPALVAGFSLIAIGCATAPAAGRIGEGTSSQASIVSVDSARPPTSASVRLDNRMYVALVLVAPGHSATLLFPDSSNANQFPAGTHRIQFEIPDPLLRIDTLSRRPGDMRIRTRTRPGLMAIPNDATTYLLLVASPDPLEWGRMISVTAGVSIPVVETEALNAVAKALKSTIREEPQRWAGHYVQIGIRPPT